jgi:hypothetical protein
MKNIADLYMCIQLQSLCIKVTLFLITLQNQQFQMQEFSSPSK